MRKRNGLKMLIQVIGNIRIIRKQFIPNSKLPSHKFDCQHTIPITFELLYPVAVGITQHQDHGCHLCLAIGPHTDKL